jgi:hypothetical protein
LSPRQTKFANKPKALWAKISPAVTRFVTPKGKEPLHAHPGGGREDASGSSLTLPVPPRRRVWVRDLLQVKTTLRGEAAKPLRGPAGRRGHRSR